jgi:hypothetical protein
MTAAFLPRHTGIGGRRRPRLIAAVPLPAAYAADNINISITSS